MQLSNRQLILIIDDHSAQLQMMPRLLQDAGYRVLVAQDGSQGMEIARRESPDLIIGEALLPRVSVGKLPRRLGHLQTLSPAPLLYIHDHSEALSSAAEELTEEGCEQLDVPFDPQQCVAKIKGLLQDKNTKAQHLSMVAPDDAATETLVGTSIVGTSIVGTSIVGTSIVSTSIADSSPKGGSVLDLAAALSPMVEARDARQDAEVPARETTPRQHGEEVQQLSEAHNLLLFAINPQPMWFYDVESLEFLAVNDAAIASYGYSREEFLAMTLRDIRPPKDIPNLEKEAREYRPGFKFSGEWQHLKKDGSLIEVAINSYSISLAGREARLAQVTNITERKKTERQLKQSEERFRALIENAADLTAVLDAEGRILYVSPSIQKILGYQAKEWLSRSSFEFIHADDLAIALAALQSGLRHTNSGEPLEIRVRHKNGNWRVVEANAANLLDNDAVQGIVINARDITERKHSEALLHAADRRAIEEYEGLLDHLATLALTFGRAHDLLTIYRVLNEFAMSLTPSFGVVICAYDETRHVRQGVYFNLNRVELDSTNLTPMPVRSGPASKVINSGQTMIFNDYLEELQQKNALHVGGEMDHDLPRSALIAPMINMGRTTGTIEVQSHQLAAYTREHATAMQMAANLAANAIENIRLLKLERDKGEQLRQSQKMDAIGQLAGGIAHDFNNLLTAINGYSELSLQQVPADHPLHDNLVEIKKAGERAAALTRQLLAFSRKQVLQPEVLNLNTIVVEIEKMLRRLIGEDIELQTILAPAIGNIKADPGQLEQVILNLVVNARDAMPGGGTLTITTESRLVEEATASPHLEIEAGHFVVLKVSDDGIGMDEATQAHLFEPFFTTKAAGKGTGLGLSTVYGIVQQSGGHIVLDSTEGLGTTFSIWLPQLRDEATKKPSAEESLAISQGHETILLTEDEETVRNLVHRVLEMLGYQVLEAADGATALAICESYQGPIHLLLTDIVMPKMNGRELAARLSQQRPETRVLLMSGYSNEQQSVCNRENNFIQKPFTPDLLAKKIRDVLDTIVTAEP
ncbi:MAG: PAS domain S-box protein [Acidobacteria bacterium]|nr:PAS domain S-box protein [Acidobacteriota bacterium]